MSKTSVVDQKAKENHCTDAEFLAQVVDTQYDVVISEALKLNDLRRVTDIQWGRLFLTQKYGL